jgi:hypothetical protein
MKGLLNTKADIENFVAPLKAVRKIVGEVQIILNVEKDEEKISIFVQEPGKTALAMIHYNIPELFTNFEYASDHEMIGIRDINKFVSVFSLFDKNLEVTTINNGTYASEILLKNDIVGSCYEYNATEPSVIKEGPRTLKAAAKDWAVEFDLEDVDLKSVNLALGKCQQDMAKFTNENGVLNLTIISRNSSTDFFTTPLKPTVSTELDVWFARERIQGVLALADSFTTKIGSRVGQFSPKLDHNTYTADFFLATSIK